MRVLVYRKIFTKIQNIET